jgi:hypothetical protein
MSSREKREEREKREKERERMCEWSVDRGLLKNAFMAESLASPQRSHRVSVQGIS